MSGLTLWPVILVVSLTGLQEFDWPLSHGQWAYFGVVYIFYLIFLITFVLGVYYSSSVFMALGMTLVIPVTFFWDYMRDNSLKLNFEVILGSVFVVSGFIMSEGLEHMVSDLMIYNVVFILLWRKW